MSRVLVVDDEPQIRRALATNLRAREFLRSALERIHAHMGGAGPTRDE